MTVAETAWQIVSRLQLLDVPHHVLWVDGGKAAYVVPRQPQNILPNGIKPAVMEVCGVAICVTEEDYTSLTLEKYTAWLAEHVSLSQQEMEYCHEDVLRRIMSMEQ